MYNKAMNFNDYQIKSRETAQYPDQGNNWVYPVLGLAGETGEVIEKLKKVMRNDNMVLTDEFRENIKKELGDVLWYLAQVTTEMGLKLDDVATTNIDKLQSRLARGVIKSEGDDR
jgi:NTP pyrophosphatase (non-canonical NTP hydrolase)